MREGERRQGGLAAGQRRAERLERLLDAGLQLFGTDGYARTSVEGLCARAGVSSRRFEEHFSGCEDVLEAVYDAIIVDVTARVVAATAAAPLTVEDQTRAGLEAFVTHLLADTRRARVVLIEVVGVSPRLERRRRDVIRAFAAQAEGSRRRLIEAGVLPDRPLGRAAIMLVGAVNELLVDCMYRDERPGTATLVDETTRLWVAAALAS
ncbi:MAG: hypothetical protein QOJ07_3673 [Thermoleophilaceae bacterium]|jgi:AcrR family transcriptional regulator|nr:hypothetical protein [Thermoleophilaceae bacterium]